MSLRGMIQALSEDLAISRRRFDGAWFFNRRRRRDALLSATAYGVQNCLRALAMLHSDGPAPGLRRAVALHKANTASGIETEGQDGVTRLGAKHESPTPKGDAQPLEPKD